MTAPAAAAGRATAIQGDESRDRLVAAARLYYVDDLGQHEIARILGISRSQVSRLLSRARELGIVRISVEDYDPRDRALEDRLVARYGLHWAVVVRPPERGERDGRDGGDGRGDAPVRRAVGYFGAPALAERLRPGMTLGLAGGRTLAELVGHVVPPADVRDVTLVQLMGNIGPAATEIDGVELCRLLAQRLGGTYCAISAPAIAQSHEVRELFLAHEQIQHVWGLFRSLQLALVGVGTLVESAFIERRVLPAHTLDRLRGAGAVGEICGRFFDAQGRECDTPHRDRVISIDLETLRGCPEVVAVTSGAGRTAALRAAIRGALIHAVILDEAAARALLVEER